MPVWTADSRGRHGLSVIVVIYLFIYLTSEYVATIGFHLPKGYGDEKMSPEPRWTFKKQNKKEVTFQFWVNYSFNALLDHSVFCPAEEVEHIKVSFLCRASAGYELRSDDVSNKNIVSSDFTEPRFHFYADLLAPQPLCCCVMVTFFTE